MSPRPGEDDWDFTPVIDLIHSLSIAGEDYTRIASWTSHINPEEKATPNLKENGAEQGTQLGNFDRIWQYLGQSPSVAPPTIKPEPTPGVVGISQNTSSKEQLNLKGVRWRDELQGADLADSDDIDEPPELLGLTRGQRKKARRKLRREAEAAGLAHAKLVPSYSENESEIENRALCTPVTKRDIYDSSTKDVIYHILYGTAPKVEAGHLRSGKPFRTDDSHELVASSQQSKQILRAPAKESAYAVAAAKKAKLMKMLNEQFHDEKHPLSNVSITQHSGNYEVRMTEYIHVFVDASNIMIGFHDALKLSRGQPLSFRMRRQHLSFHNLSLILERGRHTAKRILVGSDNFPAIEEARQIGYETNILDRVHKAKELTPRQKRYSNGNGTSTAQSGGSGSETTGAAPAAAVQYAPEKWVEQAVDEILHLKMMESIVDASEPAIMVLATGDAAEAEYSGGFLKMVERALAKGWRIELVSFRHNTSGAYKRREFRQKWGEKFRIVELDDFVEVLLGSE